MFSSSQRLSQKFKTVVNNSFVCLDKFKVNAFTFNKQNFEYIVCFGLSGSKQEFAKNEKLLKNIVKSFNNYELNQIIEQNESNELKYMVNDKIDFIEIFRL